MVGLIMPSARPSCAAQLPLDLDQVALDLGPADHSVAKEGVWSIARLPLRSDADRVRFASHLLGLSAEADAPPVVPEHVERRDPLPGHYWHASSS